jgi:hypothetical protein
VDAQSNPMVSKHQQQQRSTRRLSMREVVLEEKLAQAQNGGRGASPAPAPVGGTAKADARSAEVTIGYLY